MTISALGAVDVSTQSKAVALKQVSVGADVLNAQILAGFRRDGMPINADAAIGRIIVAGNWSASSAVAGIEDTTGDGYGINDQIIPGGRSNIVSRIASIIIAGTAMGSEQSGDHFGVTAEQIGPLKIGPPRQDRTPGNGGTITLAGDFTAVDFA